MSKINYATVLQLWSEKHEHQVDYCTRYGEPGYTNPEKCIFFANWNDVPKRIQDGLESQGYALEWCDEWYIDYNNNGKAYRTSPNSYGWESHIMFSEVAGDYLTPDDDIADWIAQCENNARCALPSWWDASDIEAHGWKRTDDTYESGLHPGQNDSPKKIADAIRKAGKEFLFQINRVGQFDVRFHVWIKQEDAE